jgi:NADH:ubiquinone reductase (H+-translocating)
MVARRKVVIVGAGFGGLQCAKALIGKPVDVLVVDERNYHLFTPLLYQVASCLLAPAEIATPLRTLFRRAPNVRYRQGRVVRVDTSAKELTLADDDVLAYDALVLATGSTTNFYGKADVEQQALGLKDLGEALRLRNHVLTCLERAVIEPDGDDRRRHLTFCIVGAGPTGVEYAGALAELVRLVLPREYPELDHRDVRIVLVEGTDRVLPSFTPRLSAYAQRTLERLGVEVRCNSLVASADERSVTLVDGTHLPTYSMVWAAGVRPADPLDDPPAKSSGRIDVDDHLGVRDADGVYAIGDVATGRDRKGAPLPMLATPAMQEGRYVAREVAEGPSRRPFRYRNRGSLATIGRSAAVGKIGPLQFTGFIGWVVWLTVHIYYLIGFGNRVRVLARWAWYYLRLERPVRIIARADDGP